MEIRSEETCSGEPEARNFAQLLSGPLLDFYVGLQRIHWALHSNLLTYHAVALEGLIRSSTGGYELPEDDPQGFELLVKWMYRGHLEIAAGEDPYESAVACQKLYVLCEKFGESLIPLRNTAMDLYRQYLNQSAMVPDPDEIGSIYHMAVAGSPLRQLMVHIAARQIMDPDVERQAEDYGKVIALHPEFALELINAIRAMSGGILLEDPTDDDDCTYHVYEVSEDSGIIYDDCASIDSANKSSAQAFDDDDDHSSQPEEFQSSYSPDAVNSTSSGLEEDLQPQSVPESSEHLHQDPEARIPSNPADLDGTEQHDTGHMTRVHKRQRPRNAGRSISLPAKINAVVRIRVDEMVQRFDRLHRDKSVWNPHGS